MKIYRIRPTGYVASLCAVTPTMWVVEHRRFLRWEIVSAHDSAASAEAAYCRLTMGRRK